MVKIAVFIGRRRKGETPTWHNACRFRINCAVFGSGCNCVFLNFLKARNYLHVGFRVERPVGIGTQRPCVFGIPVSIVVPTNEFEPIVGHGRKRNGAARINRANQGITAFAIRIRTINIAAFTRIDGNNLNSFLYVVSRKSPVGIGRSCHNRAEAHWHTRFVCPVLELPARGRNSNKH